MCLIPEWDLFTLGCIITGIGLIILLCIIPIYKSTHPKKHIKTINWGIVITWLAGIIGALIMGFGMSRIMVGNPSKNDLIIGLIFGIIGLIVCVLNYPFYAYIKENKKS